MAWCVQAAKAAKSKLVQALKNGRCAYHLLMGVICVGVVCETP